MDKEKILYSCTEYGASFPKCAGQCGDCGARNTLIEMLQPRVSNHPRFSGLDGER